MRHLTTRRITIPLTFLLCALMAPAIGASAADLAPATGTLRIYLARHGQTDWNAERRMQGSIDTHLNATGREQAAKLAARIKGLALDRVYCSRLSRSRETAEIAHGSVPIDSLAGLNEQSVGRFQGLKLDGSDSALTVEWQRRSQDPDDALDGGESLNQLSERVGVTVATIRKRHAAGNILIVGHGNTNKMLLRALLGLTMEQALGIQQANDELYLIEIDAGVPPRLFKLITETTLITRILSHLAPRGLDAAPGRGRRWRRGKRGRRGALVAHARDRSADTIRSGEAGPASRQGGGGRGARGKIGRLPGHDLRAGDSRWEDAARGAEGRWARSGGSTRGENALGRPPGRG